MSLLAAFGETQHPTKLGAVDSAVHETFIAAKLDSVKSAVEHSVVSALDTAHHATHFTTNCLSHITAYDGTL